jgi:hypothetical protein
LVARAERVALRVEEDEQSVLLVSAQHTTSQHGDHGPDPEPHDTDDPGPGCAGDGDEHEGERDEDDGAAEVGLQHDQGDRHEDENPGEDQVAAARRQPPVEAVGEEAGQRQHDAHLRELRGLEGEARGQRDP